MRRCWWGGISLGKPFLSNRQQLISSKIQLYGASVSNFHLRFYAYVFSSLLPPLPSPSLLFLAPLLPAVYMGTPQEETNIQCPNELIPRYCVYE